MVGEAGEELVPVAQGGLRLARLRQREAGGEEGWWSEGVGGPGGGEVEIVA